MINFHPDENLLIEYAAGTLDWGLSISVKTHLSMCPKCRSAVNNLNLIGAAFLESGAAETKVKKDTDTGDFNALMARIRNLPKTESSSARETQTNTTSYADISPDLPQVVRKLLPNERVAWRRVTPSLKEAQLTTGQNKYEVCLHKIGRGGKVAEHDHGGREVTVVLQGSFSDEHGTYKAGDFIYREPGQKHRPTATQDQDCLCLSLVEAPVRLTGFIGRLINPYLSFQPG